jgi:hypothetical protein
LIYAIYILNERLCIIHNDTHLGNFFLIKHSTSFFTPTIEEMGNFLNKNNLNIHLFEKKNVTYYFYKYYKLIKIICAIMLNYLLGYMLNSIYKEKTYIANKLIKILFLTNSIQTNFNHFLHNTYYFKTKIKCNTKSENYDYYTTMINAIKK